MKNSIIKALTLVSVVFHLGSVAAQEAYRQDFDSFADGTTDLGDGSTIVTRTTDPWTASVEGGALRLTQDGVRTTWSAFHLPRFVTENVNSFRSTFEFLMETTMELPADGFSFNYGSFSTSDPGFGEGGFGRGLSVQFDTWGADIRYDVVTDNRVPDGGISEAAPPVDGEWHRAEITWLSNGFERRGSVTLVVDGEVIFDAVSTGAFAPRPEYTFAFTARTGAYFETLLIDNLEVTVPARGVNWPSRSRSERACAVARLRAASKYSKRIFNCAARWHKTLDTRDTDDEYNECLDTQLARFGAEWQRIEERLEGVDCEGLSFAGTEELVREDIMERYMEEMARRTSGERVGATRAKLMKIGSTYTTKLLAAEVASLRKYGPERRDARQRAAAERYHGAIEKTVARARAKGQEVRGDLAPAGGEAISEGAEEEARLVVFDGFAGITSDLLAYWDFDGTGSQVPNRAGNNFYSGTLENQATRGAGFLGASSLQLDGARDYARFARFASDPGFRRSPRITISAWIHPGPGSSGTDGIIVNQEGEFEIARFRDGTIRFAIANENNTWDWSTAHPVRAPEGEWTHVVFRIADGFAIVTVNGESAVWDAPEARGDQHPGEDELWVGDRQNQPQSFAGRIDEVGIWTRIVSDVEVRGLYNGGEGKRALRD